VAHHVLVGEGVDGYVVDVPDDFDGLDQAAAGIARQIDLSDVDFELIEEKWVLL
jgi:hypothetical protein